MKKRLLSLLLAVVMVIGLLPATAIPASAASWDGSGTIEDPYRVETVEDLENLSSASKNTWYKLMNDIDLSEQSYYAKNVISSFAGILDGGGHKITGLQLEAVQQSSTSGVSSSLIGTIQAGAYVMNLVVENPTWVARPRQGTYGKMNSGIFCKDNNGTIDNCTITGGTITTDGEDCAVSNYVALLCYSNNGTIRNCTVDGTMNLKALTDGNASGYSGLVIENNGTLANCKADITVNVSGYSGTRVDSLVPLVHVVWKGNVYNCWGSMNTTTTGDCRVVKYSGISAIYGGTVSNCYGAGSENFSGYSSGQVTHTANKTPYSADKFNQNTASSTLPGLLTRDKNGSINTDDLYVVQFTGDYSGMIQSTSNLTLPTASTETQYALWTVGGKVYEDGDTVTITGDTTITCTKYNKGTATAVENGTATYDGTAKTLTGTVTWNKVDTAVATGDNADVPTNYSLKYRVGSSGDWGEAITPGTYNVAITVKDSYYYNTQENVPISGTLTISKVNSSVSLTVDPTTSKVQDEVTLTATVTGISGLAMTGKVTFYKDGNQLGQADVSGDTATYTWKPDLAGTYSITAKYEGGDNYEESTSNAVSCTVNKGTLTAENFTVTGNGNVTYDGLGHGAQVTANVSGAGTITVWYQNDETNVISDEAPVNIGTYSILVSVEETANFNALTQCDTSKDITITKGIPTMTVTSDEETYTYGDDVKLTATVTGVNGETPAGIVTFKNGEDILDTVAVVDGTAALTLSKLDAGTYDSVTATFEAAEGNYNSITTPQSCPEFTVEQKDIKDASIELGTVDAYDGTEKAVSITSVTVGGVALDGDYDYTIQNSSDKATDSGEHTLTIQGTGNYSGTASQTWNIEKATLSESNKSTFFAENNPTKTYDGTAFDGAAYSIKSAFTGELTGALTVHYRADGGSEWSTDAPADGGTYDIGVTLPNETANFNAVNEPVQVGTLTINKAAPTVTVTSDKSGDTSTYEDEVTFTIIVNKAGDSAAVPTGTVTLKSGSDTLGSASLENGTATIKASNLKVDTHTITAEYAPAQEETNYQTNTSGNLSFTVSKKALTFTVSGADQVYDGGAKGVTIDSINAGLTADDFTIRYYEVYENGNTLERTNAVTPIGQGKYLYVIDFKEDATGDNYTLPVYTVPDDTTSQIPTTTDTDGRAGFMTITSGQASQQQPIWFASGEVEKYATETGYLASENLLTNPNGTTVTYTSTNHSVATVDNNGNVTIVGAGTTTIRATSEKSGTSPVYASYTLRVVKKPITVTANDKAITYGDALNYTETDVTVSDGVELSALDGDLNFSTRYAVGSGVGTYDVTPAGLTSDQYDITFVPGTLTVNEKVLNAGDFEVSAADKTYDGTTDAVVTAAVKPEALVNGDSLTVTAEGSYTSENAGTKEVEYTITGLTGAKAANYKLAANVTGQVEAANGISRATVNVLCPAETTRTYTGDAQSVTLSAMAGVLPFDSSRYTVYYTKDGVKTDAPTEVGEYDVSVELEDEYKTNYEVAPFTAKLVIENANQDVFYISGVPGQVHYSDAFTLSAAGAQGDVTWNVQGPAEIDNGKVTVTGTGMVTVTATSKQTGHDDRTATVTFHAEKRVVYATAAAGGKTYDGTTDVAVTYTLHDVKNGTEVNGLTVSTTETPHTADAGAGSGKIVYINGLTLTGTGAENYTLQSGSITTTVDIAKKEITGFTFTAADKVYDGYTSAEVTGVQLVGVLEADKNDVALTGGAAFDSADAGERTVNFTADGLTGSKAGNYELTTFTAQTTASITPMPITFTVGATTFAYDGSEKPVAVSAYDANGAVFIDFTVLYNGEADVPSDADEYAVTVKLDDSLNAANYDITDFPSTTLTITAVSQDQLTIVGLPGSVEYGTSFTLQALGGTGDGAITWKSSDPNVAVTADQSDSSKATVQINGAVGETVTITATKAGDGNHEEKTASVVFMPVARNTQFTITDTTQTYDGNGKQVTVTPSVNGATYEVTYNGSTDAPTAAGTYTVVVTGKGNYTGTAYGLLTIQKATLSDLTVSLDGWTYGETSGEPTISGDAKGLTPVYSYSTADGQKPVNAGTYTVYATFTGDNYETLTVSDEFTIAKKELTATAVDAQRDYGEANPVFEVEITGFVYGEDKSALWQLPVASCTADATSPAGEYEITVSGGSAQNYTFAYVPGTLTVNAASGGSFYIDGVNNAQVGDEFTLRAFYGAAQPEVEWSSSDPTIASIDETTGKVVAHKAGDVIITATLQDDNYSADPATFTLHVTKQSVNLQVSGTVLTYNGQPQGITLTTGDSTLDEALKDAIQVEYTLTTDPSVTDPRNVGTYSVNYHIDHDSYTGSGSTTLYINKANVELKAPDLAKTYGDANPAHAISGLLGDDAADSDYLAKVQEMFTFTSEADATGVKTAVGEYPITLTLKDGHSLTEDANYNFTISETPGKLTVNTREITVTAKDQTIAYTKEIAQGVEQVSVTNLNEGTKLAAITLTASTDAIGSGTITPSGAQITWDGADVTGNYAVTYADGGLTVTKLPVTVSAGTGRPTDLTVHFSEPVEGAAFAVTDEEGGTVTLTETAASSDNRSYTLSGTFESGKAYTVAVTADAGTYELTGSPVEITVTSGGSSGSGGGGGAISSSSYAVTVETADHGTVTADKKTAAEGETVTLTVQAEDGYHLSGLTVTAKDGSTVKTTGVDTDKYTFTMPADGVIVRASFAADAVELPFTDVHTSDWFYDAVAYIYGNGVMNGVSGTRFAPNAQLNRAMIAQVLYNLEGRPDADAGAFPDVSGSAWYADAVNWAAEAGLVTGYGDHTFRPEDAITREQLAAILYRYARYKGYDTTQGGIAIREYADYQTISSYAVDAMTWAVNAQLVNGVTDTTLQPKGTATRAQVAAMLMRFLTAIAQ